CLANPAVPAKDVAVRRPPLLNGILERAGNVLLPDYLGEFLRTVLTRQDLIAHGGQLIIREAWAVENRLVLPLAQNLRQRYPVPSRLGLRTGRRAHATETYHQDCRRYCRARLRRPHCFRRRILASARYS